MRLRGRALVSVSGRIRCAGEFARRKFARGWFRWVVRVSARLLRQPRASMSVAPVIAARRLAQKQRVRQLYRHALKHLMSWAVQREVFYDEVSRLPPSLPPRDQEHTFPVGTDALRLLFDGSTISFELSIEFD